MDECFERMVGWMDGVAPDSSFSRNFHSLPTKPQTNPLPSSPQPPWPPQKPPKAKPPPRAARNPPPPRTPKPKPPKKPRSKAPTRMPHVKSDTRCLSIDPRLCVLLVSPSTRASRFRMRRGWISLERLYREWFCLFLSFDVVFLLDGMGWDWNWDWDWAFKRD